MKLKKGQTLVLLLVFMSMAIIVTTTAVAVITSFTATASRTELSQEAFYLAESGIENALINLLRNPFYSGEILTVGSDTITITVTGSGPYTINSTARTGTITRRIQTVADNTGGVLSIISWQERF